MSRAPKLAVAGAALALMGAVAYDHYGRAPAPARRAASSTSGAPKASSVPGTIVDPVTPARPVFVDTSPEEDVGDWVKARPRFQYSRAAAERGGVEPCATQTVDSSAFSEWAPLGRGRLVVPKDAPTDADGNFGLVIHLHGEEPVLRELVKSEQRLVLYSLTLSPSQSYAPLFSGTHFYEAIVADVETELSKRTGKPAHAQHVALSAWSAGFVGIEAALAQPVSKDVDAVVLVDGLHAPRTDVEAFKAQLQPFVDYARRAAAGERFFFVSHSSIDPPGYASTTECAHYLIDTLGGKPQRVKRADPWGLELVEYFTRAGFHVRGYAGNDKADHCAQLAVLRDVYAALGRRWSVPSSPPSNGTTLAQ